MKPLLRANLKTEFVRSADDRSHEHRIEYLVSLRGPMVAHVD